MGTGRRGGRRPRPGGPAPRTSARGGGLRPGRGLPGADEATTRELVRLADDGARRGGSGSAWHDGGSALGGHPDWIQDPDRPDCPLCGRAMLFASMNGGADIWGGEGCPYVFVDLDCRTGAVLYQQS